MHETADGRRFLVMHGDQFDVVVMHARWVAALGSWSYEWLVELNRWFNIVRRKLGFTYWSLSDYIKRRVKSAKNYKTCWEDALIREARTARADGVICGHIHWPEIREIGGLAYYNTGDWVESCTALVEHFDGRLEIIEWFDFQTQEFKRSEDEPVEELMAVH
jgi:UDP-2,3-diacylglucosamine pyrophosphatase LpxH